MKKVIGIFILLGIVTSIIASNLSHKNVPECKVTPPPCPCSDATIIADIADCFQVNISQITYNNVQHDFTVFHPVPSPGFYTTGMVYGTSCPGIPKPMCCTDISISSPYGGCTYTVNCDL